MVAVATAIIPTCLHSYQITNENQNEIKIAYNVEKFEEIPYSGKRKEENEKLKRQNFHNSVTSLS